jgi:amino acid transporter
LLISFFTGLILSIYLTLSFPLSLRVRFFRPRVTGKPNPVYGFFIVLSIGVGSTLGSPLFILIPENALQYGIISTISLLVAAGTSLIMARVYNDIYLFHKQSGKDIVGGPAFVREAYGVSSVRYFISRTSMWVANSALAAYCVIIFFDLLLIVIPSSQILTGTLSQILIYGILALFVFWFIINAFFEERYTVLIGKVQLVMMVIMAIILVAEEAVVFHSAPLSTKLFFSFSGNWFEDILIDTGYLFILFFGFQEIMAFQRSVNTNSEYYVPIIKKRLRIEKDRIIKLSMIATVIISSSINILYSLAVLTTQKRGIGLESASIPAFNIANSTGGGVAYIFMIIAFIIATLTTFVPAFLAASRHLRSLGEDRIFPLSFARYSWIFTLIFIIILVETGENFLLSITDFMVLVSLAFINLSALRYREQMGKVNGFIRPLVVGILTFTFGAFNYFIDPDVVLFSIVVIATSYLIHNIINMEAAAKKLYSASILIMVFLTSIFMGINYGQLHSMNFSFLRLNGVIEGLIFVLLLLFLSIIAVLEFMLEWILTKGGYEEAIRSLI